MKKERWIWVNEMTADDFPVWLPVFITEFVVILIINTITIIAFARIRQLRKRSTYLIMNLTVIDLLVGAVTGPIYVYQEDKESNDFTWAGSLIFAIEITFPISSQVNHSLISLERLHATLFPFRHCLITKRSYIKIVVGSWFIIFALAFVIASLSEEAFPYAWALFSVVNLVILAVSVVLGWGRQISENTG